MHLFVYVLYLILWCSPSIDVIPIKLYLSYPILTPYNSILIGLFTTFLNPSDYSTTLYKYINTFSDVDTNLSLLTLSDIVLQQSDYYLVVCDYFIKDKQCYSVYYWLINSAVIYLWDGLFSIMSVLKLSALCQSMHTIRSAGFTCHEIG